ncbi:hypothetical protein [Polycladidibacter hongkongensis]|uniref:hypothetical protein n=1 Tax=Polycladidibacter hongkongensis TaxID=1647556 RepID=UPI001AD8F690|nr:hypothetical protein [Pseudovibrio hongkongensis]
MSDLTLTPDSLELSGKGQSKPAGTWLARILFALPILGWLLRDASRGRDNAKYFLIANVAVLWALAIYFFGYPAFIVIELAMVVVGFVWIIAVCR